MKLLIIGGGIGGLTTALACQHFGIDFEVYEAAPEIKEVGAGIWVPPNAMEVMHRLGLSDNIRNAGKELESISVGGPNGEIWYTLHTHDVLRKHRFGTIAIHRARLQQILYNALDSSRIHTGMRLKSFLVSNDKVVVNFENGLSAEGDAIVGADGLRSQTRRYLIGEMPLRYSGQTCWRGIVKHRLPDEIAGGMRELWGMKAGQRFAYSQITDEEVYYYGTLATSPGGLDEVTHVKEKLLKEFGSFGDVAASVIGAIDPANVIRTDLYDLKPMKTWTKGNVALLGDAAHATTPNLGQGAAQAIEDAYVLVDALKKNPNNIASAFNIYQQKRVHKAHHVVNTSWKFGQLTNLKNPTGIKLRNWMIRSTPAFITNRQIDRVYKVNF